MNYMLASTDQISLAFTIYLDDAIILSSTELFHMLRVPAKQDNYKKEINITSTLQSTLSKEKLF